MLGLGFKQSKDEQVTGMNAFQDMLARLNGKTEELAKAKEAQVAVQTTLYCDSKFGPMRFVRGGWLVGDTLQESPAAKLKAAEDAKTESKKRKVEDVSDSDSSSEDEKARKKRRKEERKAAKKLKAKSGSNTPADETSASEKDKKKKSKSKKDSAATTEDETDAKSKSKKSKKSKRDAESTDSDAEKAAKKEKKRLKKEQKRAEKASSTTTPTATGTSTPAAAKSGTSTPILRGHHAVRSKWIKSKSMATLDDAALNQVRLAARCLMRTWLLTIALDFHDQSACCVSVDPCRQIDIPLEHSTYQQVNLRHISCPSALPSGILCKCSSPTAF